MKSKFIIFVQLACMLLIVKNTISQGAGNAVATDAGSYLYNNNYSFNTERANVTVNSTNGTTITLKGEVMMNVRATSYTAIFAMTQSGENAYRVDSIMSARIAQIRAGLAFIGVPDQDIHVDAVSVVPTYDFRIDKKKFTTRSTEVPTGFEMKKNIHVLFKRHEMLDRIISEMAYADVYDLVKVEYNIDGAQTYLEELRKAATDVIETKKRTYTDFNFHLELYHITDGFNCSYPMERYKSYTAYNSGTSPYLVSMVREELDKMTDKPRTKQEYDRVSQQYIIETAQKNKTIFYDRIPYNQFDKVINADIEEPCIQYYYTLQLSFTMLNDEQFKQREEAKLNSKNQIGMNGQGITPLPKKGKRRR